MESLTCDLADVNDNKKHGKNLLFKNLVTEVVKGGCIQVLVESF